MEVSELSWQYIALALAEQESIIASAITTKNQLLKELVQRKEFIKEQYRRGEIPMERGEDE